MHLEPAEGLQIGGERGQSLIQGLLMEQVYPSTKMGGGVIYPRPWPLIKVVFPVIPRMVAISNQKSILFDAKISIFYIC